MRRRAVASPGHACQTISAARSASRKRSPRCSVVAGLRPALEAVDVGITTACIGRRFAAALMPSVERPFRSEPTVRCGSILLKNSSTSSLDEFFRVLEPSTKWRSSILGRSMRSTFSCNSAQRVFQQNRSTGAVRYRCVESDRKSRCYPSFVVSIVDKLLARR